MRRLALVLSFGLSMAGGATAFAETVEVAPVVETPVVIGRSYALPSAVMNQTREINVWLPPGYDKGSQTYPVLYVLDGGQDQDFHHISGIAQLGTIVGTTRDVIVVGIASVDRRNELALPTENAELIARYPTQGQSERFRRFVSDEVMPFIEGRFRTSGETALMGESLAGLFVVETFLKEPQMFDAYVAVSPSLWWDGGKLARQSGAHLRDHSNDPHTLILTLGDEGEEMQAPMDVLTANLRDHALPGVKWDFTPRPSETHASIYHGAALDAFRRFYAVPAPETTPMSHLGAVSLLVRDYDEAIAFYVGKLGFDLSEDTDMGGGKRWVRVTPKGGQTSLLLARAATPEQLARIGDQAGGRVWLFLYTDDLMRDHAAWLEAGVVFRETPRHEAYGKVVVFEDLYGNAWDLIEPATGV